MPPKIEKEYPAGSMHKRNGWEGQLARVSRWLDRLIDAKSADDAEDFLYTFFQNAYHLRDWSPGGRDKGEISEFLNAHLATRICRDLANVTKHHELTSKPSQVYEPSVLREYVGKGRGWFERDSRLVIVTNHNDDGIVLDAREVAKECLRLWCIFLSPCEICDSIASHFHFSADAFGQVVSAAENRTTWARRVMSRDFEDVATGPRDDEQSDAKPTVERGPDGESSPSVR